MADGARYPAPGCVVEYMEGNAVQIALAMEESGGYLRLLLPNRRETRLAASRLLPWPGPVVHTREMSKEQALQLLEQHKKTREERAAAVAPLEAWEIAQGEVSRAPAQWFAELFSDSPDEDMVAAYGRALLACKSHFRLHPPDFLVYTAEQAEKRLAEQRARETRDALATGGTAFFRLLWDIACKKRQFTERGNNAPHVLEWPSPEVAERLKILLYAKMRDPENQEHDALWAMLVKGLPDSPHLPVQLLTAWGEVPEHHNFWLDRADYAPGDAWWLSFTDEVQGIVRAVPNFPLPECGLPFVSIDSASTRDVDDAFFVERTEAGFTLILALAAPALFWPFEGRLNKAVLRRAASLYLPEGTCHMLPEFLGTDVFSLTAGQTRPALCIRLTADRAGAVGPCEIFSTRVRLAANLNYADCQAALEDDQRLSPLSDNAAIPYADMLRAALDLARLRQQARIAGGAVIMNRPEPVLHLRGEGMDTLVTVEQEEPARDAQNLVAEMMILASGAVADWAAERNISLLHRTQDVALPKEYAGVWTKPEDMARVMRALVPSCLEIRARRHAALAVARYAPVTSPLRRYTDLVNEAQVAYFLRNGKPLWDGETLARMLGFLLPALEATGQVQRFRPRYWKLLYLRQQGDKVWWPGVITEENDAFVNVSLPELGLFVRGRRQLFDERTCPGMPVSVRLGKINPLYNEVQILETAS
ncbi:MAG: RNB domain-containing ribonuclease [Desulfovibrio sp.]|jgi:exoribonuclease-2|nr:RNB domain-containing ribonuclease [Desulfovibrio sp.]